MNNETNGGIPAGEMAVVSAETSPAKSLLLEPSMVVGEADTVLLQNDGESREDYITRLLEDFHVRNQMSKRGQAIGLLRTISQTCEALAMHLAGAQKFNFGLNPLPGLFYQMEVLRGLFPCDQAAITASAEKIARMYYLTARECEKAFAEYKAQGVSVSMIPAAWLDGEQLYVLSVLDHQVPEGEQSALQIGQLMWFNDPEKQPAYPVSEDTWNPYYVAPPVEVSAPAVNLSGAANEASDADFALKVDEDQVLESPAPAAEAEVAADLPDVPVDESGCEAEAEEEDLCVGSGDAELTEQAPQQ